MGPYVAPLLAALIGAAISGAIAVYKLRPERDNILADTAHKIGATLEQVASELQRTREQLGDALTRIDHLQELVEEYRDRLADYETRWGPDLIG